MNNNKVKICNYKQKNRALQNRAVLSLTHLTQLTFSLAHVTYFFELVIPKKLNDVYPIAHSIIHQIIHHIVYRIMHWIITELLTESFFQKQSPRGIL